MLAMLITKNEVSHLIEVNNQALMNSFKDLLQETLSQPTKINQRGHRGPPNEGNKEAEAQRATKVQTES